MNVIGRETVYIGFGSNQGNRLDYCDRALTLLGLLPHSQLMAVSSLYETQPVVDDRTDPGTDLFFNGAVCIETEITPRSLLEICLEIERALGRDREADRGPRTLDLDILFYGSRIVHEGDLDIPHPRLHLRQFVLAPLVELNPSLVHPELGVTVKTLLEQLPIGPSVRRLDAAAGSRYGSRPVGAPPSSTL